MVDLLDNNDTYVDGRTTEHRDLIFKAAEQCQRAFQKITSADINNSRVIARLPLLFAQPTRPDTVSIITLNDVRDDHEQFRVWARNLGVFAPDEASLDFRLRDTSDLHDGFVSLLESLSGELTNCLVLLEHDSFASRDSQHTVSEFSSDSDDSFTSDESASGGAKRTARELQIRLLHVTDIVDKLIRLAVIIRSSGRASRAHKAADYIHFEDGINLTEHFEDHYLPQILTHRFKLEEPLLSRFVKALSMRRRSFMYQAKHQQRLAFGGELKEVAPALPFEATSSNLQYQDAQASEPMFPLNSFVSAPSAWSTPTRATPFQYIPFKPKVPSRIASTSTRAATDVLEIPPPPEIGDRETHFQCPYCCILVPRQNLALERWKNHIIADLQPFLCIEPDCLSAEVIFETQKDWLDHQKWNHAMEWWCDGESSDHRALRFSREVDYVEHIRTVHKINDVVSVEKRVNTAGRPSLVPSSHCPFCDWQSLVTPANLDAAAASAEAAARWQKDLIKHITNDLLRIFLLALPDREDLGDNESAVDTTISQRSSVRALSDISLNFSDAGSVPIRDGDSSSSASVITKPLEDPGFYEMLWSDVWKSDSLEGNIRQTYQGLDSDDLLRPFFPRSIRSEQLHYGHEESRTSGWAIGCAAAAKDQHADALHSRFKNPKSGLWILEQKTIDSWMNEETPKCQFVWINGMPGAGKTVLASVIIEHCTEILMRRTAYYYCKYEGSYSLTDTEILKALFMQQVHWKKNLMPLFTKQIRKSARSVLRIRNLAEALFTVACDGIETQYIVIDGIDECPPTERANILDILNSMVTDSVNHKPGQLRVLICSRNEDDIRNSLPEHATEISLSEDSMSQRLQQDINVYVERRAEELYQKLAIDQAACERFSTHMDHVNEQMRLSSAQAKGQQYAPIRYHNVDKALGQFLYAKRIMDNFFAQDSQEEFFTALKSPHLPSDQDHG